MSWRSLISPLSPPYDPLVWERLPFPQRARQVCEAWALQGYGSPLAVTFAYGLKIVAFALGWALWCSFSPQMAEGGAGLGNLGAWWAHPVAFTKAIVWSLLFEVLGLGCGSGPLTGRYLPPVGGALYWLRPGTTKLPLLRGLPLLGGHTRGWLDVAAYASMLAAATWTLVQPAPAESSLGILVGLVLLCGLLDRTLLLAARAEHFVTTLVVLAAAGIGSREGVAGAMAVQLALWFWAGFSKLNHHFPTVVCVMNSNSPLTRFPGLRKAFYRSFPDDLRPSSLAVWMGHGGTALELAVPLVLAASPFVPGALPAGLLLMFALHAYILSNVPMGVPLEWNVVVVYGGLALFAAHPDVSLLDLGATPLAALLFVALVAVPLAGNLWPERVSFLLSMRYYAGNWPWSVWLFRGESRRKLMATRRSSPWLHDQLERFYPRSVAVGVVGKVLGFRLMHLHGRALGMLLPRLVDRFEDYEYLDGELVAGLVLGWNFGDGHLHSEALLEAIQAQCGFEPGELRCCFVEGQPLHRRGLRFRLHDAATGLLEEGTVDARELRRRQPWDWDGA